MEKSIKGTETEKLLLASFAGESQAKNRYTFFAKQAKKDGFVQISKLFEKTALQEEQHAKTFFRFLEGGSVEITEKYPAGIISTTLENLKAAAEGEHEEAEDLYPHAAQVAEKEGFPIVAAKFKVIASVEKEHEKRYLRLYENVKNNTAFQKKEKVRWECTQCGFVYYGENAPQKCPSCDHPQEYFEMKAENY